MLRAFKEAFVMLVVLTLITGVVYPLVVTGIAHAVFPAQAGGNLIERGGKPVGSALVGQPFSDPKYFWGRPSATAPMPYNAGASSGSNQGPLNPALADAVKGRIEALRAADPDNKAPVPVDLVTASASGLDPHISPAAAEYQASRVAKTRRLAPERVRALVAEHTEDRQLGFLGEPRVNVLRLNLALDKLRGVTATRPDPDQLLARVQRDERAERRGKLKIFFGACAGVGKTYAMLLGAREQHTDGVDVAVGLVETHGRKETAALVEGLEVLPRRSVPYRGVELLEFDLDAAIARKPRLIVLDELAHTNAPGSRHAKRWQDVDELLDAGIDVYTAMNVQHLESLNDVVGKITNVRVWETVPDRVFDDAHEVELVDLPPDELIERLEEGKVYMPEAAENAVRNFFRKGNLIALREMALRRTAERVDRQMREYRTDEGIDSLWPVAERIVVCVGPGPNAERTVRAGARIAARLNAGWTAVYVETPRLQRLPDAERDRILRNLRLAERLGGIAITLGGGNVAAEILAYARSGNATRIVVGRAARTGLGAWLPLSAADRIVAGAADLEVVVVGGDLDEAADAPARALIARSREHLEVKSRGKRRWPGYAWAAAAVAAATGVAELVDPFFEPANQVMIYLLAVTLVAMRLGRGPSVLAAVLAVVAFDFFYVTPRWSFAVSDTQYIVTFAVMLAVGLIISNLAANIRTRARIAGYREQRTAALYSMSRELGVAADAEEMMRIAVKHVAQVFESQAVILLPDRDGRIRQPRGDATNASLRGGDASVAQWVFDHGEPAGLGTDTLPAAHAHYLPLAGSKAAVGVLAMLPANPRRLFIPEQSRLLETFASQIALALERAQLGAAAKESELSAESERLRNALLAAISHDLRTPLASIVGASSSLIERGERIGAPARAELATAIQEEAERMSGVIDNVLDMARLQAGAASLNRQWHPLEEIVGATLKRLERPLAGHRIQTHIPETLPAVNVDGVLIGQLLANLLENAVKYTPAGTTISISAEAGHDEVLVSVADEGPGLPAGEEERVFDKFHRAAPGGAQSGVGLGLSICKAIVQAHGGSIAAENLPAGGAVFRFTLPLTGTPPEVAGEAALRHAA